MGIIKYKVGNNKVFQINSNSETGLLEVDAVLSTWENAFSFNIINSSSGLRSAQLGALYSIKSHWTVSNEPATIVMPTGTGKTETMIATVVSEKIARTLIIVPNNLLRTQTVNKFIEFGVLQDIGIINNNAIKPIVTMLSSTPKQISDLEEILRKSNIVITTMSLLYRFSNEYLKVINQTCNALIVDEAHHIAANTWTTVKFKLKKLKCLQFTATPFRNDGKKIDGKIIYNFPLYLAQKQGYFKQIDFLPVFEYDEERGDFAIASAAANKLDSDLAAGYNHLILVRAKDKLSANRLYNDIYFKFFKKYKPVIIHSDIPAAERDKSIKALNEGTSKIVVCVDMFGEGIDIPSLKIAAIHDKYKSLPITLQFIGRFARSSEGLGTATVVTNIANDDLNESLRELYAQDSDWNDILHIMSDREIDKEISLQELSEGFDVSSLIGITIKQFRPKISMIAYSTNETDWAPESIYKVIDPDKCYFTVNNENRIIIIIEKLDTNIEWSSFKGIYDTNWNLHLVYWNPKIKMFFINSTSKGISDNLANVLFSSSNKVIGENVFRCLYGIKRLMLGTVGLKSAIDGPIRYRMFAGIDIANGITESNKESSYKSNLFGTGYSGNGKISIGCSYKGRIWSRWVESIEFWMNWCNEIASRLQNEEIDSKKLLEGALVPEIISERPKIVPYGIEWPIDMELNNDNSYIIKSKSCDYPIYNMEISLSGNNESGPLRFTVGNDIVSEEYELRFNDTKFEYKLIKSASFMIKKGKKEFTMTEFFNEFPPRIKFIDQSILDGNLLVKIKTTSPVFNLDNLIVWDWKGTDIKKESQGIERDKKSIQFRVIKELISKNKFCVIFDDDGAGEIADIVTIMENNDKISIQFYHCKFSHGINPGSRVNDLYDVCCQAEKSVKWCQEPSSIIDRIIKREALRLQSGGTRFEVGSIKKLKEIKNKMRVFPTNIEIFIVQPGINSSALTDDMIRILNVPASYLMDTYSISLQIISS